MFPCKAVRVDLKLVFCTLFHPLAENAPLLNEPTAINRGSSAHSLALKWKVSSPTCFSCLLRCNLINQMKTQANRIEDQGAAEDGGFGGNWYS